jgi:hypothetical protein
MDYCQLSIGLPCPQHLCLYKARCMETSPSSTAPRSSNTAKFEPPTAMKNVHGSPNWYAKLTMSSPRLKLRRSSESRNKTSTRGRVAQMVEMSQLCYDTPLARLLIARCAVETTSCPRCYTDPRRTYSIHCGDPLFNVMNERHHREALAVTPRLLRLRRPLEQRRSCI